MTKKVTAHRLSLIFLSLALVIFFAIASGGCGGSSSNSFNNNSDNNSGNNREDTPPPESNSQPVVLDDEVLDSDGDKLPDILDFNDIEQKYYSENEDEVNDIDYRRY